MVFPKLFGPSNFLPSLHEVNWLTESVIHSPDLSKLEQYEFQLLFCPDDTQRGYPQYPLIEDSAFVCTGYTQKMFNYWQQRDGSLPIPMEAGDNPIRSRFFPPPLKVKGELHAIRPYQFRDLDNYKDNLIQFERKRVRLLIPYREVLNLPEPSNGNTRDGIVQPLPLQLMGKQGVLSPYEKVHTVKAWMYVGRPDYWSDILDAGFNSHPFKPVQSHVSRRAWLKEYYSYPKREITG